MAEDGHGRGVSAACASPRGLAHATFDLGGVDTALATEHVAPLFFATVRVLGSPKFNISLSR
jgi:hypothetical protein